MTATLTIPWRVFRTWDDHDNRWHLRTGWHRLRIGRSSRDLRLTLDLNVHSDATGTRITPVPARA